jgi:hypothetical protein
VLAISPCGSPLSETNALAPKEPKALESSG